MPDTGPQGAGAMEGSALTILPTVGEADGAGWVGKGDAFLPKLLDP
jgi:hypothetical protein